jgi:hypothetical protein
MSLGRAKFLPARCPRAYQKSFRSTKWILTEAGPSINFFLIDFYRRGRIRPQILGVEPLWTPVD